MIVTGFSAAGYKEYGKRLLDSYDAPFPLIVFTDGVEQLEGVEQRDQSDIPGLPEFLARWKTSKAANGREPNEFWKEREYRLGYSFKWDAWKFCKMVFTMWAAAHMLHKRGETKMIWLDGDSVIRRTLPDDLFERAVPADCSFAYLGREPKHSETGFLAFRLPECLPILDSWVAFYAEDTFVDQQETHSAYLFDRAREMHTDIKGHNLTPSGSGHVIHQCWVGQYIDHLKGSRKTRGRSQEAK
jgi:hypothetical protein